MGEIADMMLDGEVCEQCGMFLDEPLGYPGLCGGCAMDNNHDNHIPVKTTEDWEHSCPTCYRMFKKEWDMKQHQRDKHKAALEGGK